MPNSSQFNALLKEAQFTKEMLGVGATQIRKANYATKGIYFQAFTNLSTGLERIGKLCFILDYYIETSGRFPDFTYLKKIGHDISLIYKKSVSIINDRSISLSYLQNLDGNIHQNILTILSDFAKGDRYANLDLLVGKSRQGQDPIGLWFEKVDVLIFETWVSDEKKRKIEHNAHLIDQMIGGDTTVRYTSEVDSEITRVEEASFRTGTQSAVAPYRQLLVVQIIRFWVELAYDLQYKAMRIGKQSIPFMDEIFAPFNNPDSYIKTRKTWDKI